MNVDVKIVINGINMDVYPLTEKALKVLETRWQGCDDGNGYFYPNYTFAKGAVVNILTREGLTYSKVDMPC